jgi:hypothetical protein
MVATVLLLTFAQFKPVPLQVKGLKLNPLLSSTTMKARTKYKGGPSEILDSILFEDYEIKSLRHGNTNHVLYCAPRGEDFAPCWTMDLETAKKGVLKWKEAGCPDPTAAELSSVESSAV